MTNSQETKSKLLAAIPSDKLYAIHNDLRKYYNKWDKQAVISLTDTAGIENFYTTAQYFNRLVPIAGAALVTQGNTETGIVIAGISLYVDYLITNGKEKLFKSEEKKKKLTELTKDIENLYDRQEELTLILQPLHLDNSSPLSKLIATLQTKLIKLAQPEKTKEEKNKNGWKKSLSYLFWSLRQDESSKLLELRLLNNGIKELDSWHTLATKDKTWAELSRLFISWRNSYPLWTEWENAWEFRRHEHGQINHLIEVLQTSLSEYHQGLAYQEIENKLTEKLSVITSLEENLEELAVKVEEQSTELQNQQLQLLK